MSDDGSGRSALVKLAHRTGERGKGGGGACGADGEHVAWFWGTKNKWFSFSTFGGARAWRGGAPCAVVVVCSDRGNFISIW